MSKISVGTFFDHPLALASSACLGLLSLMVAGVAEQSVLATLTVAGLLLAFGSLFIALTGGRLSRTSRLQHQFWVTFGFRVLFTVAVHFVLKDLYGEPFWSSNWDEAGFFRDSGVVLKAWQSGNILQTGPGWHLQPIWAWLHAIGLVRFVGSLLNGDTVFNVKLISCMSGALIVPYVYQAARQLFDARVARLAAGLAFWLPDYWEYSSMLMRDAFVSCLITVVFYQVIDLVHNGFRWRQFLVAVVLNFGVIHYLRPYLSFVMMGIAGLCMVWSRPGRRVRRMAWLGMLGAIVLAGLLVITPDNSPLSVNRLLNPSRLRNSALGYTGKALNETSGDSLGAVILRLPFFLRVPLTFLHLLLLPLPPWGPLQQVSSFGFRAPFESLSGVIWYGLVPFLGIGLVDSLRHRRRKTIWVWIPTFVLLLILAVGSGAMLRWRLMPMPFMIVLVAHGWKVSRKYRQVVDLTMILVIGVLVLYMMLKYLLPGLGA